MQNFFCHCFLLKTSIMDSNESSSSDTDNGNDGVRGRTRCKMLKKMKRGRKIDVEQNERGQYIGKFRKNLQSYIGVLAKSRVSITLAAWSDFDDNAKVKLWNAVQAKFNLENHEMKNILSSLGESWKHFKSTLTRKYVMPFKDQPEVLKCVPKTYKSWIRQPAWDRFVETRLSDEFQKISRLNAERRAQKKYNHRVSKKGYVGLEEELKAELGSAFDPNDRAFKWKRAHQDKNHCYVDDATKEVGERIDMYTEKVAEGEIIIEGSRDVLTLSLGTDEHYGRVRAVGKNITPTTYFHLGRCSSKKHIHELESLLKEERDKRKEEEEKRKGFEHEFMLLKEKVKELEEGRLVSPSERMASNSRKSDNRDYILPSDEEYQSPPKRPKKQGQEKRKDIHRVATKAKSNLGEKLNRDFEKYKSSDHQTTSKPKTKANEVLSQKSKTQTTFLGTTPGLGKVKNCKLALDVRTNIVAEGKMYEGYGPDQLLHVPANEELCTVMGAKGSYVAWPRKLVIYGDNESENRKGVDVDRNNPGNSNPNPTPNNKEGIQCSLAACLRADVVAKGTLYEGFGPNHKVQGIELGKENVVVSVDEVIKGYVFLPIAIDDELVVISDAHGKLMPWPKRLVIHDNDEITKRENRWKESTKIEMTNKRRIDDLEKQISEFANVVESTMTTTSHVILPLEEEFLEQDLPPLYITKSEVLDICHMHQVNVICITTYMRFLYEKLKNSQTLYGFANPAIFDDFGTKNDQSKDLRNRLENAKLRKHQHILVPYNLGRHWVLIVIDMSQMKVYWLNSLKGKPAFMFICAVNSAIVAATYANGSRKREVTWESVQCPQQPGSTECAYYVMKFMRHFVNNPDQSLETKITRLSKTKTYTLGDLVEVRHELINFIKELSPLD